MFKYKIHTYPMTFTNDFPIVRKEIVAKKISPDKIIKDFYGRKVTHVSKTPNGYIATSGYVDFRIEVTKVKG